MTHNEIAIKSDLVQFNTVEIGEMLARTYELNINYL